MKTWRERILKAKELNATVSDGFALELVFDSENWNTCAVGERKQKLEEKGFDFNNEEGEQPFPFDRTLDSLGFNFYLAVGAGEWDNALKILDLLDELVEKESQ